MALNLMEQLSPLDQKRIKNYILTYGIEDDYIGNDRYLENWNKNKKKLFHLLGGNLIYRFPVTFEKPQGILDEELHDLYETSYANGFIKELNKKITKFTNESSIVDFDLGASLYQFMYSAIYIDDSLTRSLKYKSADKSKTLQLQKGMKPIRALGKLIEYFEWNDLKPAFEDFRIAHSMIFNEKKISGNMCISIHPLDFITMSDNDSDWSSCMSWKKDGCYRVGTVEMMNSNNVVCCYLESKNDWNFNDKHEGDEAYTWNNKKWRQLFYVTKEIAACGKAYPYQNKEFSLTILDKIKELSEQNLGRSYEFGPEPYLDMRHVGSKYRMEVTKERIANRTGYKKRIIFDTKGMYNDFFNDHDTNHIDTKYWCYRNKVKKTLMINVSGKAPCVCCGDDVIYDGDVRHANYDGAYNDRYENCGSVMCESCTYDRTCDSCHDKGYHKVYHVQGHTFCEKCLKDYYKICPSCGNPSVIYFSASTGIYAKTSKEKVHLNDAQKAWYRTFESIYTPDNYEIKLKTLLICPDCISQFKKTKAHTEVLKADPDSPSYRWVQSGKYWIADEVFTKEEISKYYYSNLKSADISDLG